MIELRPSMTLTLPDDTTVPVESGTVIMDAAWSPFMEARLSIPLDGAADLIDRFDPATAPRVILTLTEPETLSAPSRHKLVLRGRTLNHRDGTIEITLTSGESLLQDYSPMTPLSFRGFDDLGGLVLSVVRHVIPDAVIDWSPGGAWPDITAAWELANLIPNPSFEGNTDGWATRSAATNLGVSFATSVYGSYRGQWSSTAAGNSQITAGKFSVRGGDKYYASVQASGPAGRPVQLFLVFYDPDDREIRRAYSGATTSGQWAEVRVGPVTAPPGAATVEFVIQMNASAAGQACWVDGALLTASDEAVPYFDGLYVPEGYTGVWEGTENLSPSRRVPIMERRPESFTWWPGTSAWEFVDSFLAVDGITLWNDPELPLHVPDDPPPGYDSDRWYLAPADMWDELALLTPDNIIDSEDQLSRDNREWADGVVVTYRWRQGAETMERTVSAGSPGRVKTVTYDRPYPGGNAAEIILEAAQIRRRTATLDIPGHYREYRPPRHVAIALPGTPQQAGRIGRVEYDVTTAVAQIECRDLYTNLVTDPGFATALGEPGEYWGAAGPWSVVTGGTPSADRTAWFEASSAAGALVNMRRFPVTPGKPLEVSVLARNSTDGPIQHGIWYLDADGTPTPSFDVIPPTSPGSPLTEHTFISTPPPGAVAGEYSILATQSTTGSAQFQRPRVAPEGDN